MKTFFSFLKQSRLAVIVLMSTISMQQGYGQHTHEVSAYVTGVFSSLDYEVGTGHRTRSDNGGVGIGYAYAFNEHWSLGVGGEVQSYNTQAVFKSLEDSYSTVDNEGDEFEFNYEAGRYEERQYVYYLNIPLTVTYQSQGEEMRFYASGGIKMGLPIHTEYSTRIQGLHTSGFYPQWNALLEAPMFMGFGEFGNQGVNGQELDLDNSYSLMAETGVKHVINEKNAIYLGIFVEYGLNTINKSNNDHLINYNTQQPTDFIYNSVFTSSNKNGNYAYTDDVRTFAAGIKIRYAFLW